MSFKDKLKSGKFIIIGSFILAAILVIIGLNIAMMRIENYTNHGEVLATPNFVGMKEGAYKNKVEQNHLRYVVEDSLYMASAKPGSVIEQRPKAGHEVKENRIIHFVIASKDPEKVKLPVVSDISYREARVSLEERGLKVGHIEYTPSDYDGLVIRAEINGRRVRSGARINKGESIDLIVGKRGKRELISIPNLEGLSKKDAETRLSELMLNVGVVLYDSLATTEDTLSAVITKQSPAGDQGRVLTGSSIDIWLGLATANDSIQDSNTNIENIEE